MDRQTTEEDVRRDELVRLAGKVLLPRSGRIPPPPDIDVVGLIAAAHRRPVRRWATVLHGVWADRPRPLLPDRPRIRWAGPPQPPQPPRPARPARLQPAGRHRLRRWGPPVFLAAVVVLLVGGVGALRPYGDSGPPGPGSTRPGSTAADPAAAGDPDAPLPLTTGHGVTPARHQLAGIARHVDSQPDLPAGGRYTYVHLRTWWGDDPATGLTAGSYDQRLWWTGDRSGQETRTDPADPQASPELVSYRPGTLGVAVPDPSADRTVLAGQLAEEQPLDEGPQAVLRSVVGLYRFHDLSAPHRAAALAVLADTELYTHGPVLDRAGRSGVAISATGTMDGTPTRDTIVVDSATGRLLGYERVDLPAGDPDATGTVAYYVVFLDSGRVGQLGAEPGAAVRATRMPDRPGQTPPA
ncbi:MULTISPECIES: hypothetical protein [unclassified Solwaraspora]|uniref:hypothetical protein n=1 Tax=unclassified Solwaraspora TaxID=2627926 RepID=UPI00259BE99B|nr:hypothetical protein [Solwaraspora sp. WMMA2056]WJK41391.1 hypothetical protein O7608_02850 [Solwaraspora sp. WMMA2056]